MTGVFTSSPHGRQRLAILLLLASALLASCQARDTNAGAEMRTDSSPFKDSSNLHGAAIMIPVEPNSRSLILSSSHILVLRIASANVHEWKPREPNGEERTVSLSLILEEIVKGTVRQQSGDALQIDVKQVRLRFSINPPPGVWSIVIPEPGTRLVAFGRITSDNAIQAIDEPGCVRLVPSNEALADVHLAVEGERNHAALDEMIANATPSAHLLGWLFADYVWARYGPQALTDIEKFELLAGLLESPDLHNVARTTMVMNMTPAVDMSEPAAEKQIERLVISLFRLLGLPSASALHSNILQTYLPALINLTDDNERAASKVFGAYPVDKINATATLSSYKGGGSPSALLQWLKP